MNQLLIIDDSIVQGHVLKQLLENEYQITICQNGLDGLETAKDLEPCLILLDVIMPGINGFEVLQKLKQDEVTKDIPVILITSLSDVVDEEKGLLLGAVDYIVKPFQAAIVKARVHTHTQLYIYRKTIENMARMDGLTGIPNRRFYNEYCETLWKRAIKNGEEISIALLDIDFFKQYNDFYGHPSGDEALRQVAQSLYHSVESDEDNFAARYGGEEFTYLMPHTSALDALQKAEHIRSNIENLHIEHETSSASDYLTVSIGGITIAPCEGDCYESYFKIADNMLYKAKRRSRNTVVWQNCKTGLLP